MLSPSLLTQTMSFLSMLGNFKAAPNETKTRTGGGKRKEWNPTTADLRIFKDGSVFPSEALVADFNLEYQATGSDIKGLGFDVIDSRQFPNTREFTPAFIMIAPVDKKAGKVDLFNACTYGKDGKPLVSVMDQGSNSFGKTLLIMLKEVYGIELDGKTPGSDFIDLNIEAVASVREQLAKATGGIYNVPKTVSRGEGKGLGTYVRRENLDIYVLVPAEYSTTASTIADTESKVATTQTVGSLN